MRRLGLKLQIALLGESAGSPPGQDVKAILYPGRDATALRQALAGLPADVILLLTGWLESPPLMEFARQHAGRVYVAVPPTSHLLAASGREAGSTRLEAEKPLPIRPRLIQLWTLAAARLLEAAPRESRPRPAPGGPARHLRKLRPPRDRRRPGPALFPARHLGAPGAIVLRLGSSDAAIADWRWVPLE